MKKGIMKNVLINILIWAVMLLPFIGGICVIEYNFTSMERNHYKYEKFVSHNNNEIKHRTTIAVFYSDSHIDTLTFDTKSKVRVRYNKCGVWVSSSRKLLFGTNAPIKVLKNE